jgi:translation initiation factor IF-2
MTTITVADFANELKRPPTTLLEQLQAAGVGKKSVSDAADRQPTSSSC